jgi:hypothetical protein
MLDIFIEFVNKDRHFKANENLKNSITKSRELCWSKIHECGIPGLVVAVSVNGKLVWKLGKNYNSGSLHAIKGPSINDVTAKP